MSPRKRSIENVDDIDDQDGIQEDEKKQDSDLKLRRRKPDDVDLGGVQEEEPRDEDREERR